MIKRFILLFFLIISVKAFPQFIPEHISNTAVYAFIDELATDGIISVNSSVKPYSKTLIAEMLMQASQKRGSLSRRQSRELTFYLKTYRPDLLSPDTLRWNEITYQQERRHLTKQVPLIRIDPLKFCVGIGAH